MDEFKKDLRELFEKHGKVVLKDWLLENEGGY